MIDDKTISRALDQCWKEYKDRFFYYQDTFDEGTIPWLRERFYDSLAREILPRETRFFIELDTIRKGILEKDPSLPIQDTKNGFIVEGQGDSFGVEEIRNRSISVHSKQYHRGWDATLWTQEDIAAFIIALAHFPELNAPRVEAYIKELQERDRRREIQREFWEASSKLRAAVDAAIEKGQDPSAYRESFFALKAEEYRKLGDEYSEETLEGDWQECLNVAKLDVAWKEKQAKIDARKASIQKQRDDLADEISRETGLKCTIVRRRPMADTQFDAYIIELSSGQKVAFRDYAKKLGSLTQAIEAIAPILDRLTLYAGSKLTFGSAVGSNGLMSYTATQRKHSHEDFEKAFQNNDTMLYLEAQLSTSKAPALMEVKKRSIRLHCFFPRNSSCSLSFSLKSIGSHDDADALVLAIEKYSSARKKFECRISNEE